MGNIGYQLFLGIFFALVDRRRGASSGTGFDRISVDDDVESPSSPESEYCVISLCRST